MNKIKTLIIDDEEDGRATLNLFLEEYCPEIEIVGFAASKLTGIEAINRLRPELVFLDIEMPEGNGFELLDEIPEKNFELIFVTAYDEFAINAIKVSAIDYLLKPINVEELQDSVQKAIQRIQLAEGHKQLDVLMQRLTRPHSPLRKVGLPFAQGLKYVTLSDIIRCQAENNYCHVILRGNRKMLISKTIKWIESQLADHRFFRVHASHLINLDEIEEYNRSDGGFVVMSDHSRVPISNRRKADFQNRMK